MLNVIGCDIEINRGNAAGLTFRFEGEDKPEAGTTVIFQVKQHPESRVTIIEKELTVAENSITISIIPEDTNGLPTGNYSWNACIQYAGGAEPWTLMRNWARFTVLPG